MLILIYSIVTLYATTGFTTVELAYNISFPELKVYLDVFKRIDLYYKDQNYRLEIYRYVYPDPDSIRILKPPLVINTEEEIENLKRDLTEQQCLERLPRGSIPSDFNELFNNKYTSLSLNNRTLALSLFYIYDALTYIHPFNTQVRCVQSKQVDMLVNSNRYVETYIVRLVPYTRDVDVRIPEINYSSFTAQSSEFKIINYIPFPRLAQQLTVTIEPISPISDLPILSDLISIFNNQLIHYYNSFYQLFNRSYLSLGIVIGLLYVLIIALLGFISYLSNVINYFAQKFSDPFKRALGYHNNEIYSNLIKGLIAGAIAVTLELLSVSQNIRFRQITISLFIDMIKIDPIFYVVVFGIVYMMKNIYDFIIDNIKGLIGGQDFYTSYSSVINRDVITSKFEELRNAVIEFRQELGKGLIEGIDISKYIEFVNAIPIDSLAEEIKKANNVTQLYEVFQKISGYKSKIEEYRTEYRNLYKDAEINYVFWKERVKSEIRMFGAVGFSSLTMIPTAWRTWFARKFIEENPEYVIAENMIKKLDLPKSEVLKIKLRNMFEDNYGDVVILFSDGEFLYSGANKTMVKAIMAKILAENKDIDIEGEIYRLVSFSKYGIRVLVFGKKEVLKDFQIKYNI